jgi:hypothetical protein
LPIVSTLSIVRLNIAPWSLCLFAFALAPRSAGTGEMYGRQADISCSGRVCLLHFQKQQAGYSPVGKASDCKPLQRSKIPGSIPSSRTFYVWCSPMQNPARGNYDCISFGFLVKHMVSWKALSLKWTQWGLNLSGRISSTPCAPCST